MTDSVSPCTRTREKLAYRAENVAVDEKIYFVSAVTRETEQATEAGVHVYRR